MITLQFDPKVINQAIVEAQIEVLHKVVNEYITSEKVMEGLFREATKKALANSLTATYLNSPDLQDELRALIKKRLLTSVAKEIVDEILFRRLQHIKDYD